MVIRTDLPLAQQLVQSCHATLELARSHAQPGEHPNLVLLAAKDAADLHSVAHSMADKNLPHATFTDSDLGDTITAVACGPISGQQRRVFRNRQLWQAEAPRGSTDY